ncbi:poly(A) RNA polymerase, mitochondrial isoform X2 [Anoplolepis gracilipes]|uniref:poly(A) RNA polymerase, mitochondrial isoform X2 n=1 Tax=Anoplolepis gracilipes TaxID=354296 RepID=UPI003BA12D85
MALFNRANLNSLFLLSHYYYKFATVTVRLKTRERTLLSSTMMQEKIRKSSEKKTESSNVKSNTFETAIANRRDQACRSILVQVYSLNSQDDLQNYCAQFGNILSMHHYKKDKQHNHILVEFKNIVSVNEIISSASFMDGDLITPVKSSVFWFRKGQLRHKKNNQKKIILSTENGCTYPTEKDILKFLQNAKSVSGQIIKLYEILKLSDLETRLRFHTAHHLEQYFSRLFQNTKVLPFGSSLNGFGRKRCDLDLVLVSDNIEENKSASRLVFHTKPMKLSERHETKEFMRILASVMQHFISGVHNVRKILEARVPIIKFHYEYTNIECDLTTTNMTAVYMSELLYLYGEIDWRVRPLVTVIRKWAKSQEITSDVPGQWITNFSLSLLVLFYLQQKDILPSLKLLKTYATHDDMRCTETGIDCTFLRDLEKLPAEFKYKSNQDNLESLLYGFFEYISTFDFHTQGMCIREGVPVRKPSRSALHITNPLETTLNVCKNVNIYELNRITEKAHDAVYMLETTDKSRNSNWGLMALLNMKENDIMDMVDGNKRKEQSISDYSEDYSHEISEVNEVDINQPKKKKTDII